MPSRHLSTSARLVRLAGLSLALLTLFQPLAALAQVNTAALAKAIAPAAPASSAAADATPIATDAGAAQDVQIETRLRAIYAALPDLAAVQVSVSSGVVTLNGTVRNAAAIDQAAAIAGRLAGVVIVRNQLQRSLAVDNNLDPALQGITGKLRGFVQMLPLIAVALLVAFLVGAIGSVLARRRTFWGHVAPNPFVAELMGSAVRVVFVAGGIVLGLQIVGATALLGAVLGGAGVIGLALGLAVKDTVDNYVSSLMLSIRQPFRANDHVRIDSYEGRVVRLTTRATVLMMLDGNHLRVPNSTVYKAVIINFTTNPQRRFTFDYTIDHGFDPCAARTVAMKAMTGLDFILLKPEPKAEIAEMPGSNQVLRFFAWIDQTQTDFGKARTRAIEAVRNALREAGAIMPDASYLVHLDDVRRDPSAVTLVPERTVIRETRTPREKAAGETAAEQDVAPERHVEDLVEEERSGDAESGRDLLDSGRPTE
ncbi:mechanosensitive ion channel family protein [Novosphingobium sp.]|uniref:mechanosensitive ion channel family protein n=1 Tax=Novosphingobium sp. TaxID=1874826 RepID=UPI0025D25335|nr:mechanosensitive ion channel family protein [Novosphingobium sp.]